MNHDRSIQFRISYYDVMRDCDGNWTGNYSVHDRRLLTITEPNLSNRQIEMAARRVFRFNGRKTIREEIGNCVRWIDPRNAVAVEIDLDEVV